MHMYTMNTGPPMLIDLSTVYVNAYRPVLCRLAIKSAIKLKAIEITCKTQIAQTTLDFPTNRITKFLR